MPDLKASFVGPPLEVSDMVDSNHILANLFLLSFDDCLIALARVKEGLPAVLSLLLVEGTDDGAIGNQYWHLHPHVNALVAINLW